MVTSPSIRTGKNPEEKKLRASNRLIEHGLELMKHRQCPAIVALVEPKNFLAELFFKRYGFKFERNLTFFGIASRVFVRRKE